MATKREKADNRGSIVGVRYKRDERLELEDAASAARVSLSDWIRDTTISAARRRLDRQWPEPFISSPGVVSLDAREGAEVSTTPGISAPDSTELPITWADQWALMERMEQGEAAERLAELAQGRKLPDGFKLWPKAKRIQWLDRVWPL